MGNEAGLAKGWNNKTQITITKSKRHSLSPERRIFNRKSANGCSCAKSKIFPTKTAHSLSALLPLLLVVRFTPFFIILLQCRLLTIGETWPGGIGKVFRKPHGKQTKANFFYLPIKNKRSLGGFLYDPSLVHRAAIGKKGVHRNGRGGTDRLKMATVMRAE